MNCGKALSRSIRSRMRASDDDRSSIIMIQQNRTFSLYFTSVSSSCDYASHFDLITSQWDDDSWYYLFRISDDWIILWNWIVNISRYFWKQCKSYFFCMGYFNTLFYSRLNCWCVCIEKNEYWSLIYFQFKFPIEDLTVMIWMYGKRSLMILIVIDIFFSVDKMKNRNIFSNESLKN